MNTSNQESRLGAERPSRIRMSAVLGRGYRWARRYSVLVVMLSQSSCSKESAPKNQGQLMDAGAPPVASLASAQPDAAVPPLACPNCALPNVCVAGSCSPPGTPALSVELGGGPEQVLLVPGNESATIAPVSFAVRDDGLVVVLDQQSYRLQAYKDGKYQFTVPLKSVLYEDVVFFDHDHVVLLNKRGQGEIVLMSLDGRIKARTQVTGIGIEKPNLVRYLRVLPDGVWLESGYETIRYYKPDWSLDDNRSNEPHDLMVDGKHQMYVRWSKHAVYVLKTKRQGALEPQEANKEYAEEVCRGCWGPRLESDVTGRIYVFLATEEPSRPMKQRIEVLDPQMNWERSIEVQSWDEHGDAYTFRDSVVTPKGEIYVMTLRDGKFQLLRY